MPDMPDLASQLQATLLTTLNDLIARLPSVFGALLILLFGWLLARFVRSLATRLLNLLNRTMDRLLSGRTRTVVQFSTGISGLVAEIIYWILLFVFTTLALQTAGLTAVANWLHRIVDFLPAIVTGSLILLTGYVLASLVRGITLVAAQSAKLAEADLLSRLAQAVTLITAGVVGLDQVGVDVTFITIILAVSTGTLLGAFAIAFGFGARNLVSNLIAAHYLNNVLEPGQKLRIGEYEGTLLELSPTNIMLETAQGRTSLPAKLYHEQAMVVLQENELG